MIGEYGKTTDREFWVYFTSPHPRDMTPDVIDVIAEYICLGKQIHLPIQSGDDKVLIRMNRKHSVENYRKIIHKIWDTLPQATIFTDIIVGFTGETEEQFTNTCEIMDEFKYNMAYIAMYSPRPGATSSRWADDVDHDIKKERFHRLSEKLKIHTKVYNDKMIGQTFRVLVTGKDRKEDYLSGLTEGKIVLRFACADEKLIGQIVDVKIHSAATFSVEGELIKIEEPKLS
jgi:tRNA-2-methylthio-N6-dimethylallyladenosine synthase